MVWELKIQPVYQAGFEWQGILAEENNAKLFQEV
jgi:hypothetical protein